MNNDNEIPCESIHCTKAAIYQVPRWWYFCSQECADFIHKGTEYEGKPVREIDPQYS